MAGFREDTTMPQPADKGVPLFTSNVVRYACRVALSGRFIEEAERCFGANVHLELRQFEVAACQPEHLIILRPAADFMLCDAARDVWLKWLLAAYLQHDVSAESIRFEDATAVSQVEFSQKKGLSHD